MSKKAEDSEEGQYQRRGRIQGFSIRVKDSTVSELDAISEKTNRSRNELINMMLEFGIKNCEVTEPDEITPPQ